MPQRTQKENKHGRPSKNTGSRWHNFHFSGKLISCSVIFGFLLILVGGILLAIGMDREEENKSDDYGDLQKKPPIVYVGPAVMGIGGFTVVVGVIMCLVETKVFRRRTGDANPLINSEGRGSASRDHEAINGESDPTVIPSDTKHHRKYHNGKKSKKSRNGKKSSSNETSPCSSQSSEPISISGKGSRNFLNASDTFFTPHGSITQDDVQMQGAKRDAVNQTSASLLKSYNSSGTHSTEFQTPSASYIDSPMFPSFENSIEVPNPQPLLNIPTNLNVKLLENVKHEFLTPQNSNAGILESPQIPKVVKSKEENSPVTNRHAFLTPKNSTDFLEDSPPNEETLEHMTRNALNHPDTLGSNKSPDKIVSVSVVAEIHEPLKEHVSNITNDSVKPSTNLSKPQEVEHSDIKVDVLIDAIDDEAKGNAHSSVQNVKDDETREPSKKVESNQNMITENTRSIEENKLQEKTNGVNAHNFELTSEDILNTVSPASNQDLDSRIDVNVNSLNDEKQEMEAQSQLIN